MPWKPHCAVVLHFDCLQPAQPVLQLQRFPPIGKTFQLPALWTSFQEDDDGPFYIMDAVITGLGSVLARWATQTEKYSSQASQVKGVHVALFHHGVWQAWQPRKA